MEDIRINRLVIIGNGFDLAHGQKTNSFFIIDYINAKNKCIFA